MNVDFSKGDINARPEPTSPGDISNGCGRGKHYQGGDEIEPRAIEYQHPHQTVGTASQEKPIFAATLGQIRDAAF